VKRIIVSTQSLLHQQQEPAAQEYSTDPPSNIAHNIRPKRTFSVKKKLGRTSPLLSEGELASPRAPQDAAASEEHRVFEIFKVIYQHVLRMERYYLLKEMTLLVYVDANIYIDCYVESDDPLRPLMELSQLFFNRGRGCEFRVVTSDWLFEELRNKLTQEQIDELFAVFYEKKKVEHVVEKPGDRARARKINSHWHDPLHAILAERADADYLVTRDRSGYDGYDFVQVVYPEFI